MVSYVLYTNTKLLSTLQHVNKFLTNDIRPGLDRFKAINLQGSKLCSPFYKWK